MDFAKAKAATNDQLVKDGWLEPKYDGFRALIRIDADGRITEVKGRRATYTQHFNGRQLAATGVEHLIDSEVIVGSSLQETQSLARQTPIGKPISIHAFDIIEADGYDMRLVSLRKRRQLLVDLQPALAVPTVFIGNATNMAERSQWFIDRGFEGAVFKPQNRPYTDCGWLKYKRQLTDDFVIIDWKAGQGQWSNSVGAVLVADKETKEPVGWVSPGSDERRHQFGQWVGEELLLQQWPLVEVEYQQLTKDGKLRHPRMLRIRFDLPWPIKEEAN